MAKLLPQSTFRIYVESPEGERFYLTGNRDLEASLAPNVDAEFPWELKGLYANPMKNDYEKNGNNDYPFIPETYRWQGISYGGGGGYRGVEIGSKQKTHLTCGPFDSTPFDASKKWHILSAGTVKHKGFERKDAVYMLNLKYAKGQATVLNKPIYRLGSKTYIGYTEDKRKQARKELRAEEAELDDHLYHPHHYDHIDLYLVRPGEEEKWKYQERTKVPSLNAAKDGDEFFIMLRYSRGVYKAATNYPTGLPKSLRGQEEDDWPLICFEDYSCMDCLDGLPYVPPYGRFLMCDATKPTASTVDSDSPNYNVVVSGRMPESKSDFIRNGWQWTWKIEVLDVTWFK